MSAKNEMIGVSNCRDRHGSKRKGSVIHVKREKRDGLVGSSRGVEHRTCGSAQLAAGAQHSQRAERHRVHRLQVQQRQQNEQKKSEDSYMQGSSVKCGNGKGGKRWLVGSSERGGWVGARCGMLSKAQRACCACCRAARFGRKTLSCVYSRACCMPGQSCPSTARQVDIWQ